MLLLILLEILIGNRYTKKMNILLLHVKKMSESFELCDIFKYYDFDEIKKYLLMNGNVNLVVLQTAAIADRLDIVNFICSNFYINPIIDDRTSYFWICRSSFEIYKILIKYFKFTFENAIDFNYYMLRHFAKYANIEKLSYTCEIFNLNEADDQFFAFAYASGNYDCFEYIISRFNISFDRLLTFIDQLNIKNADFVCKMIEKYPESAIHYLRAYSKFGNISIVRSVLPYVIQNQSNYMELL